MRGVGSQMLFLTVSNMNNLNVTILMVIVYSGSRWKLLDCIR